MSTMRVVRVVVLHRHGDRSPVSTRVLNNTEPVDHVEFWPSRLPSKETVTSWQETDPEHTETGLAAVDPSSPKRHSWPWGQLTTRGADEMRATGARLRERYVSPGTVSPGFMPEHLHQISVKNIVQAKSTRFPRSIHSVQNLLRGLYPPETREPGPFGLPQIEILTVGQEDEVLLPNEKHPEMPDVLQAGDATRMIQMREKVYEKLKGQGPHGAAGEPPMTWVRAAEIGICHSVHGLPLPGGLTSAEIEALVEYNGAAWGSLFSRPDVASIAMGPLALFVLEKLKPPKNTMDAPPLMFVLSGHDSTLLPLLCFLEAHDGRWPAYAACMCLELLEDTQSSEQHVRLIYEGEEVKMFGFDRSDIPLSTFEKHIVEKLPPSIRPQAEA